MVHFVAPLQGFGNGGRLVPRALPWAVVWRPFRAARRGFRAVWLRPKAALWIVSAPARGARGSVSRHRCPIGLDIPMRQGYFPFRVVWRRLQAPVTGMPASDVL